MKKYKRLLVISHNCFSQTNSNGRTLENLLVGWTKKDIAQLYIHNGDPDFSFCENYFYISDIDVVKSVINRSPAGKKVIATDCVQQKESIAINGEGTKKNSILYIIRNIIWKSKFWSRKRLKKWISEFNPEVILVQAGDAEFLLDLACLISKKYDAPIVIYNTEGYYFKKTSYLPENNLSRLFYPIMHNRFKRAYCEIIKASKKEVYNCDLLRNDYECVFHTGSRVIMNSSEFTNEPVLESKKQQIIYAGNLGLNRYKSLIEFATAVQKVDNMVVDVYGKAPSDSAKAKMEQCSGIVFHGFISYQELKKKLRESKYLIHIESFDDFYKEDLKYAFSTKIADSLASGACLFVYAPENMAVIQYLKGKNAAALITEPNMLDDTIKAVLSNKQLSETYAQNGRRLAEQNHSISKNREEFQKILLE